MMKLNTSLQFLFVRERRTTSYAREARRRVGARIFSSVCYVQVGITQLFARMNSHEEKEYEGVPRMCFPPSVMGCLRNIRKTRSLNLAQPFSFITVRTRRKEEAKMSLASSLGENET